MHRGAGASAGRRADPRTEPLNPTDAWAELMPREIRTEVRIRATADRVWSVLTDFPSYPSWNPFVIAISGTPVPGTRLVVRLRGSGSSVMTFRPRVLAAKRPTEFRWLGRLGIPGLFDGEHSFTIETAGEGEVRLTQAESFRGLLVPLMWRKLERETQPMFVRMNDALRSRAEQVPH